MARYPHSKQRKRTGSRKRYMHGGVAHSCPNGYMMQNGGCVPMNNGGYRKGGTVRRMSHGGSTHSSTDGGNNPITAVNLTASANDGWRYTYNNLPYTGPYHLHADGTAMIGAGQLGVTHPMNANEIITNSPTRNTFASRANRNRPAATGTGVNRRTAASSRSGMSSGGGRSMSMSSSSYRRGGKVKRGTSRKIRTRRR